MYHIFPINPMLHVQLYKTYPIPPINRYFHGSEGPWGLEGGEEVSDNYTEGCEGGFRFHGGGLGPVRGGEREADPHEIRDRILSMNRAG